MKIFIQRIALLGCWLLLAPIIAGQELAAFQIPDPARSFLFISTPSAGSGSTNGSQRSVEGMVTILAKRFTTTSQPQVVTVIFGDKRLTTTNQSGPVTVTFHDAVVCQADRSKGAELGSPMGSPVATFREFSFTYPPGTRVLVHGRFMRMTDFSEKSFASPAPHYETYTGEEAIKKMREMGLEPPEDMDWEAATNRESSQPKH